MISTGWISWFNELSEVRTVKEKVSVAVLQTALVQVKLLNCNRAAQVPNVFWCLCTGAGCSGYGLTQVCRVVSCGNTKNSRRLLTSSTARPGSIHLFHILCDRFIPNCIKFISFLKIFTQHPVMTICKRNKHISSDYLVAVFYLVHFKRYLHP